MENNGYVYEMFSFESIFDKSFTWTQRGSNPLRMPLIGSNRSSVLFAFVIGIVRLFITRRLLMANYFDLWQTVISIIWIFGFIVDSSSFLIWLRVDLILNTFD